MTGIHAVHMLIAMAAVAGFIFLGWRKKLSASTTPRLNWWACFGIS
jgi:hypothetical protein